MIYFLFTSLITLFLFCYLFSGKDLFAPATVQILTFAGSVFMCVYFMWSMDAPYEFQWKTIRIILSTMSMTGIIGVTVHHSFSKVKIQAHTPISVHISPISGGASILFTGMIFFTVVWLLAEIRRIGGMSGSFEQTMTHFRMLNSYSTEESAKLPFLLKQLLKLIQVLFLLYGFNLIRFFNTMTAGQKWTNFLIIGFCTINLLLTGARGTVVNLLISCIIFFHLLRIQKAGKYKQYRVKYLIRMVLLLIAVLVTFFLVKDFVGRSGTVSGAMKFMDYIAYYTGTQYILLDQYLQNPPLPSRIFGKETFFGINQFFSKIKLVDIPSYIVHLEFRPVGAGAELRSNVYTFLRSYHYDFGEIGMYLLHGLSILLLTVFYEYVKKKRGNIGILIFGQMYYTIVMSFFAERFYSNIFSANYVEQFLLLIVLYEFFIRKRIRLKFCRTDYVLQSLPSKMEPYTIDS